MAARRLFVPGLLRWRPGSLRWTGVSRRVRCAVGTESREILLDRGEMKRAAKSDARFASLAGRIYVEGLGQAPRFAAISKKEDHESIVLTILQGLLNVAEGVSDGFTICPLVTERVRAVPGAVRGGVEVEIAARAAILSFRLPTDDGGDRQVEAHHALCRAYYERVLAPFVEKRLSEILGDSRSGLEETERAALCGLGECYQELGAKFSLGPFQEACETRIRAGGEPSEVLRRIRAQMLSRAARTLGI